MKWNEVSQLPKDGSEVLGFNEGWIDEDFNPKGIRICCYCEAADNQWSSAHWNPSQDGYFSREEAPTHWQKILPFAIDEGKTKDDLIAIVFEMHESVIQAKVALERYGNGSQKRQEDLTLTEIFDCLEVAEQLSDFVD